MFPMMQIMYAHTILRFMPTAMGIAPLSSTIGTMEIKNTIK